jgi:hypothetical protein
MAAPFPLCYLNGQYLPIEAARNFAQENAAINNFDRRGDRYILRVWNDTTHC